MELNKIWQCKLDLWFNVSQQSVCSASGYRLDSTPPTSAGTLTMGEGTFMNFTLAPMIWQELCHSSNWKYTTWNRFGDGSWLFGVGQKTNSCVQQRLQHTGSFLSHFSVHYARQYCRFLSLFIRQPARTTSQSIIRQHIRGSWDLATCSTSTTQTKMFVGRLWWSGRLTAVWKRLSVTQTQWPPNIHRLIMTCQWPWYPLSSLTSYSKHFTCKTSTHYYFNKVTFGIIYLDRTVLLFQYLSSFSKRVKCWNNDTPITK